MKQTKNLNIPLKKYYIPIYCYRHWPTHSDIYEYLLKELTYRGAICIYEKESEAREHAIAQKCDDDCATTATLDFTTGFCEAYLTNSPEPTDKIWINALDIGIWDKPEIFNVK